jgi:hypothetical protein
MAKTIWQRRMWACEFGAICLLVPWTSSLDAEPMGSSSGCAATVTAAGPAKACPTASVRFHVSVRGCARSSGTFTYDFLRVSEIHKEQVSQTAVWSHRTGQWEHVDHIPLACDEEIDDVDNVRVTSCRCEGAAEP